MRLLFQEMYIFMFQLLIFVSIPFLWYLITKRKVKGFGRYVGLEKAPFHSYKDALRFSFLAYLVTLVLMVVMYIQPEGILLNPMQDAYETKSLFVMVIYVVIIGFKSGICEELLFRGFVAKRLISTLGFKKGNFIQAFIFMLPHVTTFNSLPLPHFIITMLNSGFMGYIFGYIMEKKVNGSILPLMVAHGLINMLSFTILLLVQL